METHQVRRNIVLYKLFVLFNEPLFWGPIVITSIQQLGHMSLPDIYFMEATVMGICVLLDIPAGALADLIGQKKVLIIGRMFLLASMFGFALTVGPLSAWLSNISWAIGISFQSGADVSLFYNSLKSHGIQKKFKQIEGCAVGSRLLLTAFCSLAVGPLAAINMRIPLLICIPFVAIPLVVTFFFTEPTATKKYSVRGQFRILVEGIRLAARKPEVFWMIGFCTLIMGSSKIWFFTYNPYFERVGIDIKYYGLIFFLLNIVAWISSHYAEQIEKRLGEHGCIITMILCVGLPVLMMGLLPFWPMAYMVLSQNVVRGFIRPFKGDFLNRHIASDNLRTTVLSVQSTTSDVVSILTLSSFGLLMKHVSLLNSLVILGSVVLLLGFVSYRSYRKLPS